VDVILPAVVVVAVDADLEAGVAHARMAAALRRPMCGAGSRVPLSSVRTP
jgi:hypothetical protein